MIGPLGLQTDTHTKQSWTVDLLCVCQQVYCSTAPQQAQQRLCLSQAVINLPHVLFFPSKKTVQRALGGCKRVFGGHKGCATPSQAGWCLAGPVGSGVRGRRLGKHPAGRAAPSHTPETLQLRATPAHTCGLLRQSPAMPRECADNLCDSHEDSSSWGMHASRTQETRAKGREM